FTQADIDVVDRDTLPLHYEVEMPLVVGDALGGLPIPPIRILVNNRKLCEGYYRGLGIGDPEAALRAIDKLDKIGPARVAALLTETAGATEAPAKACLALAEISAPDGSFVEALRALGVTDRLLDGGRGELGRGGAAAAGDPDRGRADAGQVRQADPVRRAARHPVRLVPGRQGGQGHPVRRPGDRRSGRLDAAGRRSAAAAAQRLLISSSGRKRIADHCSSTAIWVTGRQPGTASH